MAEVLLVRHGQSYANKRDFTAFGNIDSPLTDKGMAQAKRLNPVFREELGICPEQYEKGVAVSEYTRAQQTAQYAGFRNACVLPLINESDVDRDIMTGVDVIRRHRTERWVPPETKVRVAQLFDGIKSGEIEHDIFFSHGMFIAGFLLECSVHKIDVPTPFTSDRGYVPLQAAVVKVVI